MLLRTRSMTILSGIFKSEIRITKSVVPISCIQSITYSTNSWSRSFFRYGAVLSKLLYKSSTLRTEASTITSLFSVRSYLLIIDFFITANILIIYRQWNFFQNDRSIYSPALTVKARRCYASIRYLFAWRWMYIKEGSVFYPNRPL